MKKIYKHIILLLVFGCLQLSSQSLVNPNATRETKALKAFLDDTYGKKMISGQYKDQYFTYVKNLTGKTPAIMGLDFMDYTERRRQNGANPTDIASAIDWVNNNKGIVTFSWHWDAPTDIYDVDYRAQCQSSTGGDARWWKAMYSCAVYFDIDAVLKDKNGAKYQMLIRDMDVIAAELKKLQDAGVPVLWRPLHEAAGGWFWWGAKGPGPCKELWSIIYDRFTNHHKLNNLIWVWNCYANSYGNPMDWFPGYDKVDIIAYDYPNNNTWNDYNTIHGKKKPFALAETGGLPNVDNFASQSWLYFVSWAKFVKESNSDATIKKVFQDTRVINLEDLPDLKNYLKSYGTNLALNKPVTVTSTETGFGNVSSNATDGNNSTRWSSVYADPQSIQVDLGKTFNIDTIVLRWETAFGKSYKIELSSDGTNWTTVYQTTNSDGGVDEISNLKSNGRYVKLTGTQRATTFGYSLFEIEVYGSNVVTSTNDTELGAFSFFPNPATDIINFTDSNIQKWKITDLQGKILMEGNSNHTDLRLLEHGLYLINFTYTNGEANTYKFIKK
jgi:Glycosyl hydrolase family 26/F5/8 type C domain/Secretion system C-terminal sorting domain